MTAGTYGLRFTTTNLGRNTFPAFEWYNGGLAEATQIPSIGVINPVDDISL